MTAEEKLDSVMEVFCFDQLIPIIKQSQSEAIAKTVKMAVEIAKKNMGRSLVGDLSLKLFLIDLNELTPDRVMGEEK